MGFFSRRKIDPNSEHRDWQLVSSIAQDVLVEQKRSRRWGIFFKILFAAYGIIFLLAMFAGRVDSSSTAISQAHTAIVQVNGVIADDTDANANAIVTGLRRAFENDHSTAVMMIIIIVRVVALFKPVMSTMKSNACVHYILTKSSMQ